MAVNHLFLKLLQINLKCLDFVFIPPPPSISQNIPSVRLFWVWTRLISLFFNIYKLFASRMFILILFCVMWCDLVYFAFLLRRKCRRWYFKSIYFIHNIHTYLSLCRLKAKRKFMVFLNKCLCYFHAQAHSNQLNVAWNAMWWTCLFSLKTQTHALTLNSKLCAFSE